MSDYILPGGYSRVIEIYNGINVSAPLRSLVIIGEARDYYDCSEVVERDEVGDTDYVEHKIKEIVSVKSSNGIKKYVEDTHFQVDGDMGIKWLPAGSVEAAMMGSEDIGAVVLTDKTLIVETDEGEETVTFTAAEINLATIISKITADAVKFTAEAGVGDYTDRLVLKSVNKGDVAYIKIKSGTANSILHFVEDAIEYGFGIPVGGTNYVVNYIYDKIDSDYVLKEFYNKSDWISEYGYPLEKGIMSKMGIAGDMVFSVLPNVTLYGLQTKGATKYDFYNAIDKLNAESLGALPLLAPLSIESDVFIYLKNHCDAMGTYEERKERTGIVGAPDSNFIVELYNQGVGDSQLKTLTGEFLAILAAIEKLKVSDLARTITFKKINYYGKDIIFSNNSDISVISSSIDSKNIELVAFINGSYTEKKGVAKSGVSIIEKSSDGTGYMIRHDITTRKWAGVINPPIYESEPTSVAVRYYIAKTLRESLIARHGGEKITNALLKSIELTTELIMEEFIDLELITDFNEKDITAIQDTNTPTMIKVTVPDIKSIYNNLITDVSAIFIL